MSELASNMLEELAQQLCVASDQLDYVGGFENLVYRLQAPTGDRIVRVTHNSHRSKEQLRAELEWVEFLSEQDLPVARALRWPSGRWLMEITGPRDTPFWATCFAVAPGRPVDVNNPTIWNEELFEKWGELLAQMHAASKRYSVDADKPRRPHWHEDDLLETYRDLSDEHTAVVEAGCRLVEEVRALPIHEEFYGLVHSDLHHGNFFVGEGSLTAFDFDDAVYHHFAHDLAIPLYYACWWTVEGDERRQNTFATSFMQALLRGYRRHRELPPDLLTRLPLFLALRDWTIYLVIHKRLDVDTLDQAMRTALEERKARLLGGGIKIRVDAAAL